MNGTHKRKYSIKGIDCPNCAIKIESEIKNIDGVLEASINFTSETLTMEVEKEEHHFDVLRKAKEVLKRHEPTAQIHEESMVKAEPTDLEFIIPKWKKVLYAAGLVFFGLALLPGFLENIKPVFFVTAYLLFGWDVLLKAFKNIIRGSLFDENFLMGVATLGAFAIHEYPEAVTVMIFYQIGELFQDVAVNRSRRSISSLMNIRPDYANLKTEEGIRKVNPEEVVPGDVIIIKPGERVPVDGKVLEGRSTLDTSAITGESVPRTVVLGEELLSGMVNIDGVLTVEVLRKFSESTVSKILELVQNAHSKKAKTEQFITRFAKIYTPAVVISAALLAVIPPLIIEGQSFSQWLSRSLVFLVISCPCALVISIPLGFFGGIGGASKRGILIKGGNYLEALNYVDVVAFDKTGTLTEGVFDVISIKAADGTPDDELLKYAAYAESYSNHPAAKSILKAFKGEVDKNSIEDYKEILGHGVKALVTGHVILAGNEKLMAENNISVMEDEAKGTKVYVAVDGKCKGVITIADVVKKDTVKAIEGLKRAGIKKIAMLTGDSDNIAKEVGKTLGIDMVYSELLPHNKVECMEKLEKLKGPKGKLLFVGDGINDSPVLARADIGVAMGGIGSDAAIEAADVVLMTDEPSKLVEAIQHAKRTRMIVYQNIIFALGVKGLVLALGAGGLATMWEAVFADVGVAVLAIFNSMRVINGKFES